MLPAVGTTQQGSVGLINNIKSRVKGFTIAELRGVLRKTFSLADLKKNVKALRTDPTILSNIDKLFETYEKAK